jgi:hypothetical protein
MEIVTGAVLPVPVVTRLLLLSRIRTVTAGEIVAPAVAFVGCCPSESLSATTKVGLAALPDVPVVDVPVHPAEPVAVIVIVVAPGGVDEEVVTVSVETWSVPVLVNGLLLNEEVAPAGRPDAVRVEVQFPPLPVIFTVTDYVA